MNKKDTGRYYYGIFVPDHAYRDADIPDCLLEYDP